MTDHAPTTEAHEEAATLDTHDDHALHSDTVKIGGREITMPGGLYTLVFVVLAVVTLIEVALAESPLPTMISYPLLVALSIGKAVLVVLYYMHLMQDSRIFAWAFGIPLAMASVIVFFVMFLQPNASY
jgi:caa(3)-type oxidase subunit IV